MRRRITEAAILVGVGLAALTACSPFTDVNCPAIAYPSNATITLAHPQPGLTLEVCDGEGCIPGPPADPVQDMSGSSEVGWQVTFILGGKPTMGYRLTDETGEVVDEGYVKVDWIRIDGSEQCGGTRQATIELPVWAPSTR